MIFQNTFFTRLTSFAVLVVVLLAVIILPKSVSGDQNQKAADRNSKAVVAQEDALQKLIQEVKQNEKLYADLNLKLSSVYEKFPKPVDINKQNRIVTEMSLEVQQKKFRSELKSKGRSTARSFVATLDYKISTNEEKIDVFDGNTYRKFRAFDSIPDEKDKPLFTKRYDEISEETASVSNLARPHMFLRGTGGPRVPLSTYLEGTRAITAYPGSDVDMRNSYFETQILGTEMFQGLQCIKVQMKWIRDNEKPFSRHEFWLARDRNLIPVRMLHYKHFRSENIPSTEFRVDQWKELRPGVWFPIKARRNQFQLLTKKPTKKRDLRWRILYEVKSITLDPPQRAPDIFTKLDFPKGTTVDGLKGRKSTK